MFKVKTLIKTHNFKLICTELVMFYKKAVANINKKSGIENNIYELKNSSVC